MSNFVCTVLMEAESGEKRSVGMRERKALTAKAEANSAQPREKKERKAKGSELTNKGF